VTHPRVRVEWFKDEMLTKLEQNSHKRTLHRSNAKREFWEAVKRAREGGLRASERSYEGDELSP
jgi:hypothetical protein